MAAKTFTICRGDDDKALTLHTHPQILTGRLVEAIRMETDPAYFALLSAFALQALAVSGVVDLLSIEALRRLTLALGAVPAPPAAAPKPVFIDLVDDDDEEEEEEEEDELVVREDEEEEEEDEEDDDSDPMESQSLEDPDDEDNDAMAPQPMKKKQKRE